MKTFKNKICYFKVVISGLIFLFCYFVIDKKLTLFFNFSTIYYAHLLSLFISPLFHLIFWTGLSTIFIIKRSSLSPSIFRIGCHQFLALSFCYLVKIITGRARPEAFLNEGIYGFYGWNLKNLYHSFPSGHTIVAFTLAISVSLIFPRFKVLLFCLAAMFSFSRVILLKHYVSDIFASALITIVIGFIIDFFQDKKKLLVPSL